MKYLLEVGLELELFLMKDNQIIEPSLFGFPSDEMGFLIELRSEHSNDPELVMYSLDHLLDLAELKADSLGFKINYGPRKEVNPAWIEYIREKYRLDQLPNFTRNVYGFRHSHHTGLLDGYATAGLHVHFSKRKIKGSKAFVESLKVIDIVKAMDSEFNDAIKRDKRIHGEYELKPHGFEYRSLSSVNSPQEVVEVALNILKEVEGNEK